LLLSISATTCAAPQDDHADVAPDPPNVVAAAPPTAAAQTQCEWESGFRISEDSIGPLASEDSIGVVKELCPQVRDTFAADNPFLRTGAPLIVIPVPGGEVYGVQQFWGPDPTGKVSDWIVTGDGVLPEGLSMKSTWGDLRRAYGSGYASAEIADGYPENYIPAYVSVDFYGYPDLTFYLENLDWGPLRQGNGFEHEILLSSVPDSATIQRVWVATEWYYR
jgi:hypothetical protein